MNCRQIADGQVAERYLTGRLAEPLQDEFEVHILDCPACLNAVEALQELRAAVAAEALQIRLAPERTSFRLRYWSVVAATSLTILSGVAVFRWQRHRAINANVQIAQQTSIAPKSERVATKEEAHDASTVPGSDIPAQPQKPADSQKSISSTANRNQTEIAAGQPPPQAAQAEPTPQASVTPTEQSVTQPNVHPALVKKPSELTSEQAVELYRLAEVHPAQFTFSGLRSSSSSSRGLNAMQGGGAHDSGSSTFQQAMNLYIEGNYRDAGILLGTAAEPEPNAPNINFYLGVCQLMLGRPEDAITPLSKVTNDGKSRLAQPAHVYLAKAYLQKADLKNAEAELEGATALPGPFKGEASTLLQRVRALRTAVESPASPDSQPQ